MSARPPVGNTDDQAEPLAWRVMAGSHEGLTMRLAITGMQWVLIGACAYSLHSYFEHTWPVAIALTLLIWLLSFCAFVTLGFGIRAVVRATCAQTSSTQQAPLTMPCWLGIAYECYATFYLFILVQPFRSGFTEALPVAATDRPPILLLHGFGCNRAIWIALQRILTRQGYFASAITLSPTLTSIDTYTTQIAKAVEQLYDRHQQPVILIGHSMGGLAARAYLRAQGSGKVRHLMTLGTPHHGTVIAHFGQSANLRQMCVRSAWLTALGDSETGEARGRITAIGSSHDNVVFHHGDDALPGARNLTVSGVGHVSLVVHPGVIQLVLDELGRYLPQQASPRFVT